MFKNVELNRVYMHNIMLFIIVSIFLEFIDWASFIVHSQYASRGEFSTLKNCAGLAIRFTGWTYISTNEKSAKRANTW